MIGVSRVAIRFGHKVPNLRHVGAQSALFSLLISYVVGCIGVSMMKRGTSVSNMVSQAVCLEII